MKPRAEFGLDALLGRWPAQEPQGKGGASWDDRAEAIVSAALALKDQGSSSVTETLLAAPSLEPEPGEENAASFQFESAPERPQSSPGDLASKPQPGRGSQPDQGKKPSLKELAARASQAGAARGSIPPAGRASTPPPPRVGSSPGINVPVAGPALATVTPISRAKSARASDPGREDSGVLRLADLQAQEAAKAEAAAIAAETLAASKQAERAAAVAAPTVAAKTAAAAPGGGSRTGMWAGFAIAVMGIAAAFAVYRTRQPEVAPPHPDVVASVQPVKNAPAPAETAKPAPTEQPAAVASSEPVPASSGAAKADAAQGSGSAVPSASATAVAEVKPATPSSAEPKGSKVGTLDEEIKKAAKSNETEPAPQDDSKPASGSSSSGGNIPDYPSQGPAQAAVRAVLPAAKACVAGASDLSSASVTFGSSGSVQSVSVSGWAAQNGKTACVKSALQGAHVPPFAKPTFTVPVNIRP